MGLRYRSWIYTKKIKVPYTLLAVKLYGTKHDKSSETQGYSSQEVRRNKQFQAGKYSRKLSQVRQAQLHMSTARSSRTWAEVFVERNAQG